MPVFYSRDDPYYSPDYEDEKPAPKEECYEHPQPAERTPSIMPPCPITTTNSFLYDTCCLSLHSAPSKTSCGAGALRAPYGSSDPPTRPSSLASQDLRSS